MSTPVAVDAFSMPFVMCSLASLSTRASMSVSCKHLVESLGELGVHSQSLTYLDDGLSIGELLEVNGVEGWQFHVGWVLGN